MAASRLAVVDGAQPVGSLTRTGDRITFTYADAWRSSPLATPLSVSMPRSVALAGHLE